MTDAQQTTQERAHPRWPQVLGWLLTTLAVVAGYWVWTRPDLQGWRGMATHGNPAVRAVALTFDDGPDPLWAPLIADTLEQHGARGTFLLVGREAQRYPEITARLARAGHEVGDHSMTHPYPNLTALPPRQIVQELRESRAVLEQITGQPVVDFRPPGGGINLAVLEAARREGLRIAWWSWSGADAAEEGHGPHPQALSLALQNNLRPGLVVLLHERPHTLAALDQFLASARAAGYTYGTFSSVVQD